MKENEKWLDWAVELQALAQTGLAYTRDDFDKERFERIRDIAAEMISYKTDMPLEKVRELFCDETGYPTPKIDTRAAVFKDGRILLVRENDGRWSLPGGWCDVNVSVAENTVKEVKEEAGLDVVPVQVIAIQDREKHNRPVYAWKICKIFLLCQLQGGHFTRNSETTESGWFALEELPELAGEKNTAEQIIMCFEAATARSWTTQFD